MSLRFWSNSKSVHGAVHLDDLAWFENSVHGGVVILGIFRDAIAMSPSPYVKQIAEKTLSIIRAIAIAAIGDTGSLRINLQKLGEATAAVTATILQSYLEAENRDGWPGAELQGILEDLIKTLDIIESWVSSGQARNSIGRKKCVKVVKQFQERLSEVLERFELASLLRSYTVFPFIKKMIEDYAVSLDLGAAESQSMNADDLPKASPGSGVVQQDNANPASKLQNYPMEKELHDALRVKVRLILRIIEKEERNQHASQEKSAPTDQISSDLQVSQPDERRGSRGMDDMGGDHDNMEQVAVEMLYDMLMARLSNVAIPGPKLLSPTFEQPNFPLPSPLPNSTPSDDSDQSLNKALPSLELADTSRSQKYISQARDVGHAYDLSKPFSHVKRGIKLQGCASLPPGAMPPFVSSLTNGWTPPVTSVSIRPERSLSITPLPDIEEEMEKGETPQTLGSPSYVEKKPTTWMERKPTAPLLPLRAQESMQSSKPSLSADLDRATTPHQQALDVTLPVSPDDDTGKERVLIGPLYTTRSANTSPRSASFLPPSTGPGAMSNGSLSLPPGAMAPQPSSWSPPFGKEELVPLDPRLVVPGPIPNSNPSLSTNATPPAMQSNSSLGRQPGPTLNENSLRTSSENKERPTSYLPPITMSSPISLAPLVTDSGSSRIPLLLPPPIKKPEYLGPGEHLRKMSPHMQRYVERLADRIWGAQMMNE